jgi:hypothetical protein
MRAAEGRGRTGDSQCSLIPVAGEEERTSPVEHWNRGESEVRGEYVSSCFQQSSSVVKKVLSFPSRY